MPTPIRAPSIRRWATSTSRSAPATPAPPASASTPPSTPTCSTWTSTWASAFAGVYMVGNYGADLHFLGGRYGIVTEKTVAGLVVHAGRQHLRGPARRRDPRARGRADAAQRDVQEHPRRHRDRSRLRRLAVRPARAVRERLEGRRDHRRTRTTCSPRSASRTRWPPARRCSRAFATAAGRSAGAGAYRVKAFTYGLTVPAVGPHGPLRDALRRRAAGEPAGAPAPRDPRPAADRPVGRRADARRQGRRQDRRHRGAQAAIDAHRVLYFPIGFYQVTDTLTLKPDTVLIGLHPSTTQIVLPDGTNPAIRASARPRP